MFLIILACYKIPIKIYLIKYLGVWKRRDKFPFPVAHKTFFSLPQHILGFSRINLHDTNHGKQHIFFLRSLDV